MSLSNYICDLTLKFLWKYWQLINSPIAGLDSSIVVRCWAFRFSVQGKLCNPRRWQYVSWKEQISKMLNQNQRFDDRAAKTNSVSFQTNRGLCLGRRVYFLCVWFYFYFVQKNIQRNMLNLYLKYSFNFTMEKYQICFTFLNAWFKCIVILQHVLGIGTWLTSLFSFFLSFGEGSSFLYNKILL